MKQIQEHSADTDWESKLLKDLTFIKKNGRYPITGKILAPRLLLAFILLVLVRLAIVFFIGETSSTLAVLYVSALVIIAILSTVVNFLRTIRFINIHTPLQVADNQRLLKQFLESQKLAFFNNPDAPEVFQIISKNIKIKGDQREVMVFIADDKRILVNSHFTEQKFSVIPPSRHYRQMALMLRNWLKQHINNDNRDITPAN